MRETSFSTVIIRFLSLLSRNKSILAEKSKFFRAYSKEAFELQIL